MEQEYLSRTANVFITSIVLLIAVFLVVARIDTYLKIKAVHECGQVATYTKTIHAENVQVKAPLTDAYKTCLLDKGVIEPTVTPTSTPTPSPKK